jgi:hypothetical protein
MDHDYFFWERVANAGDFSAAPVLDRREMFP